VLTSRLVPVLLVALAAVGCAATDGAAPAVPGPSAAPPASAAPTTPPHRPGGAVQLQPAGLDDVAFGTAEGEALAWFTDRLGPPTEQGAARAPACAGRRFAHWKVQGVGLLFQEGAFAGWYVYKAGGAATGAGVAVGADRRQVEDRAGPGLTWSERPGLGTTFSAGGLSGVVQGRETPRVQALWAGDACPVPPTVGMTGWP
jgi:hypothetical protein